MDEGRIFPTTKRGNKSRVIKGKPIPTYYEQLPVVHIRRRAL